MNESNAWTNAPQIFEIWDIWPTGINQAIAETYKLCRDAGLIKIAQITIDKQIGYTVIHYWSQIPEAMTHDTLGRTYPEAISEIAKLRPNNKEAEHD